MAVPSAGRLLQVQRVVAERANESGRCALASTRDSLVETLSAGAGREAESAPRFARLREAIDSPDVILVVRADDENTHGQRR